MRGGLSLGLRIRPRFLSSGEEIAVQKVHTGKVGSEKLKAPI